MRQSLLTLTAMVAAFSGAGAANPPVATPEPVSGYQLKNRSSFSAERLARAPFWPIGHVKSAGGAPVINAPRGRFEPEMFSVTSIVLGNPSLAIINGRAYGEGEFLRVGGRRATTVDPRQRVRVTQITDGKISLQSGEGQTITVPLRRPELNEKRPGEEEALLNEER